MHWDVFGSGLLCKTTFFKKIHKIQGAVCWFCQVRSSALFHFKKGAGSTAAEFKIIKYNNEWKWLEFRKDSGHFCLESRY